VPIAGPLIGGIVGSGMYQLFIRSYLPEDAEAAAADPKAQPESAETGTVPEEATI
jgi:hypothetical protein